MKKFLQKCCKKILVHSALLQIHNHILYWTFATCHVPRLHVRVRCWFAAINFLSGESPKQQNNTSPKRSKNNNQSRIDEFINKSNKYDVTLVVSKKNFDTVIYHKFCKYQWWLSFMNIL